MRSFRTSGMVEEFDPVVGCGSCKVVGSSIQESNLKK